MGVSSLSGDALKSAIPALPGIKRMKIDWIISYLLVTFYPTVRITVLGSGSSGNCTYVASETTHILIDAGFGSRSINRRCRDAGICIETVDAVLLTHAHCDHTKGLPSLLKKFPVPVYMTAGTANEISLNTRIHQTSTITRRETFTIGDIEIQAFPTSHDSSESVGFEFRSGGITGILATDLGKLTSGVIKRLNRADWMVIESNHDEELLRIGPYPLALKRRILGDKGHISNQAVADFLEHHFSGLAGHIFLAHISRQNNVPNLVMDTAREALTRRNRGSLFKLNPRLYLTHQNEPSEVLDL